MAAKKQVTAKNSRKNVDPSKARAARKNKVAAKTTAVLAASELREKIWSVIDGKTVFETNITYAAALRLIKKYPGATIATAVAASRLQVS